MTSSPRPLSGLRFSLTGPGRVGSSLAHWLVASGARLVTASGRSPTPARDLTAALGGEVRQITEMETSDEDLLLIAVSDPALAEVADILGCRPQAAVALHTAGRSTAEVLTALRRHGTAVGSLHPLRAFPGVAADPAAARGVTWGIDGDQTARDLAERLARAWSGHTVHVPAECRSLYHLAATMAAGGMVTLLASAIDLAERVGVGPEIARGYGHLAATALEQASHSIPMSRAITGPVARGDLEGYRRQIAEALRLDPELADLLERLGRQTARLRSRQAPE